ncbi:hypothetical protein OBBRIDRAFT_559164 [Obba rivulosa]|uniref:Uncharacterized protein n=1 Tax=Obba rivulosa TaxID=1052685 RepID=A0A8E2AZA1_9APHY|nr:hypothetical protein OBBRIDRAFT_559164 [Obba rivulosa]
MPRDAGGRGLRRTVSAGREKQLAALRRPLCSASISVAFLFVLLEPLSCRRPLRDACTPPPAAARRPPPALPTSLHPPPMTRRFHRSVSLATSLAGALFNYAFAVRLLASWRSLGWDSESEWEGSGDAWAVDSVKLIWGLLSAYFAAAAIACFLGFIGIAKSIPSLVRVYRDISIADFVFVALSTVFVGYTSFTSSYVRTTACEELSRHAELMRDMTELGLNLENCEPWFERAILAVLGVQLILIVFRLHLLIALSKYHKHLTRDAALAGRPSMNLRPIKTDSLQRIYLLPTPTSPPSSSTQFSFGATGAHPDSDVVVYAPVPVGGMTEKDARKMHATEAWISTRAEGAPAHKHSHHSHSHSHAHAHSHSHTHTHSSRHSASRSMSRSRREDVAEKDVLIDLV